MKISTKVLAFATLTASALALSATANAATVQCDVNYDGYTRYMELSNTTGSPDPACFASGLVNEDFDDLLWKINFNDDGTVQDTEGEGPDPFASFTGGGGNSGSFSFVSGLVFKPGALIVFKFGGGKGNPDWFAYTINGMTSADWSLLCVDGGRDCLNALSHVSVYGTTNGEVPEPGTLALLGLGLAGLGFGARRRQKLA